jgi:hypothetical protein
LIFSRYRKSGLNYNTDETKNFYEFNTKSGFRPAKIKLSCLLPELEKLGITFSEKSKKSAEASTEGSTKEDFSTERSTMSEVVPMEYVNAAIDKEIALVSNAKEGNRNNQLNKSCFAIGQLLAVIKSKRDELYDEVRNKLYTAARMTTLEERSIDGTLEQALKAGMQQPRKIIIMADEPSNNSQTNDFENDPLDNLKERYEADPNIIELKEIQEALAELYLSNATKYALLLDSLKLKRGVRANVQRDVNHILNDKKSKKVTYSELIVRYARRNTELWHDPESKTYITIPDGEHFEIKRNYSLEEQTKDIKNWITYEFYKRQKTVPSSQAVQDALNTLQGIARIEGKVYNVYKRIAICDEGCKCIYLDMVDNYWQAIRITKDGWKIVHPDVKFIRSGNMLALPEPVTLPEFNPAKGDNLLGHWESLEGLINAGPNNEQDKRNWIFLISWLMQLLWSGPYAILVINGEPGAAKTSTARTLKNLIDPSKMPVRRLPKTEEDLLVAAKNEHVICFDNLSGISKDMSDSLCSLSTGTGMGKRALYTNGDEYQINVMRPISMNGIDDITNRGDFVDRSIHVILPKIPSNLRQSEKMMGEFFDSNRAKILSLILDAAVEGMRNMENEDFKVRNLPRMADFATWIVACEAKLPWKKGEFLEVYNQAREEIKEELFASDPFAQAIVRLVNGCDSKKWTGTATELLDTLNGREKMYHERMWPQNSRTVVSMLRRISELLRVKGYTYETKHSKKGTEITLFRSNLTDEEKARVMSVIKRYDYYKNSRLDAVELETICTGAWVDCDKYCDEVFDIWQKCSEDWQKQQGLTNEDKARVMIVINVDQYYEKSIIDASDLKTICVYAAVDYDKYKDEVLGIWQKCSEDWQQKKARVMELIKCCELTGEDAVTSICNKAGIDYKIYGAEVRKLWLEYQPPFDLNVYRDVRKASA